jgi:probable HAF family extracellular repeat protein
VQHKLLIPALAFLACSCSATDASVGLSAPTGKTPNGTDATPGSSFARVDLGTLGGASSYAADIDNNDAVVGWSETSLGATHAFRWSASTGMVDLGTLPGHKASRAIAIIDTQGSGDTQILGVSGDAGQWIPVVWSANGSIAALPIAVNPDLLSPTGFNSQGQVVGWDTGGEIQHGWIWSSAQGKYDLSANLGGGATEGAAAAITAAGRVLLTARASTCSRTVECWRTYLWSKSTGFSSLGTPANAAEADVTGLGLNENETVVGWTATDLGGSAAYRWSAASGFAVLPHLSGIGGYGYATGVNAGGMIVGAEMDLASGSIVASAWPTSGGITRLSPNDPNASVAVAINNGGTVAGWAVVSSDVSHAVIWRSTSAAVRGNLNVPSGPAKKFAASSASCLQSRRAMTSRQAVFDCVVKADRARSR